MLHFLQILFEDFRLHFFIIHSFLVIPKYISTINSRHLLDFDIEELKGIPLDLLENFLQNSFFLLGEDLMGLHMRDSLKNLL